MGWGTTTKIEKRSPHSFRALSKNNTHQKPLHTSSWVYHRKQNKEKLHTSCRSEKRKGSPKPCTFSAFKSQHHLDTVKKTPSKQTKTNPHSFRALSKNTTTKNHSTLLPGSITGNKTKKNCTLLANGSPKPCTFSAFKTVYEPWPS